MEVVGAELETARAVVQRALATRPSVRSSEFPG
jgi:hypothetical protein